MNYSTQDIHYIQKLFSQEFLDFLLKTAESYPADNTSYLMIATRHFFYSEEIAKMIYHQLPKELNYQQVMPRLRLIKYFLGGSISPHYDGYQVDPKTGQQSKYSFLLYLNDCLPGEGDTEFLKSLREEEVVTSITPKKGSILIFPHLTPHRGQIVGETGKILLRGDLL